MDDKERVVDMSDPFVKTASTTTASAVNNNEGVGAGARQRLPNAGRHQGFCWSSLEKQASLKKKKGNSAPVHCCIPRRCWEGPGNA